VSDRGAYIRAVEAHFLKYRGSGFVLSPKDEAVVDGWFRKDIPLNNILRGLDEAVSEMRERESRSNFRPRSISYFARTVEARTKTTSRLSVPKKEERSTGVSLPHQLTAAIGRLKARELSSEAAQELRGVEKTLEGATEEDVWTLLPELDVRVDRVLLGSLPSVETEAMGVQARDVVNRECGPHISPHARAEQESEEKARLCRSYFGFEGLMEIALSRGKASN
jgi:hypothetical protein